MSTDYKFSIIVPVYNTEKYLKDCIEGVIKQSYTNYELLLIDNGSKDDSGKIMDEYVDNIRVSKYAIKKNNGISGARNLGIKESTGDYLIFLDSDDFYSDYTFLERLNKLINDSFPDLVTFKTRAYYENTASYGEYRSNFSIEEINRTNKTGVLKYLVTSGTYESASWDKVIRKEIIVDNSLYFKDGIRGEDVEWFYRVIQHINTFMGLEGDILSHRITNTSTSQQKWNLKTWEDIYTFIEKEYYKVQYNEEEQLLILSSYADYWYILLGMTLLYQNKKELQEKLRRISGYRKINYSKKNKICNILVSILGMEISSRIIYKYLKGKKI